MRRVRDEVAMESGFGGGMLDNRVGNERGRRGILLGALWKIPSLRNDGFGVTKENLSETIRF